MTTYKSLILIVFSVGNFFFLPVDSLECRYCTGSGDSNDCRTGNVTELTTCTIKGEDHCYAEYILNEGHNPYYRRGCAPGDWCQQQMRSHSTALKFCSTCQGSKCNSKTIGSEDPSSSLCRSCESQDQNGECKKGTVNTNVKCKKGAMCLQYRFSTKHRGFWKRGCGDPNSCSKLAKKYEQLIFQCKACEHELCNNYPI
ncbi:uncharacterized protein LOC123313786 [Coccinella septempunctata]|uniref:uncharacterized protein LOC123313786 n=1 Tax=Coccinella septempunctata TaxID=41139 RepID=UPI001D098CB1|nr:uncharacterized protein LOC123313786 [Coccinella septempunctata]